MIEAIRHLAQVPRDASEWIGRVLGELEEAGKIDAVHAVDQEDTPLNDRPKRKWYRAPRAPEDVEAICLHITAVHGGFGSRRSDIARHLADGHLTEDEARVLAQADRFLATPYHAISAKAVVLNLPGEVVSWHGNGCNRYALGYAVDKGRNDALNIAREQKRFRWVVQRWLDRYPNLNYVETHRQHSRSRGGDPGGDVCQALSPVIGELGLMWRQSKVTGSGRVMPREWLL